MSRSARSKNDSNANTDGDDVVIHAPPEIIPDWMNRERTRILTTNSQNPRTTSAESKSNNKGSVLYWMQRDMRTVDNWALLFARHLAAENNVALRVVYTLPPPTQMTPPPGDSGGTKRRTPITQRHASFLLGGLKSVQHELEDLKVPFDILFPKVDDAAADDDGTIAASVGTEVHSYSLKHDAIAVVTDFTPLRHFRERTEIGAAPLLDKDGLPLYQVDAHNIVPVWHAADKKQVGARTLRPKINKLLPDFMTHFPDFEGNSHLDCTTTADDDEDGGVGHMISDGFSWDDCESYLSPDCAVPALKHYTPGTNGGMAQFQKFCTQGLKQFADNRNDPNDKHITSSLSPWLNHGHVSFQRLALDVRALKTHSAGVAAFIEEGVVRRELSDNFCYYNPDGYDSLEGAAVWARESLLLHEADKREYLYTFDEFANGETHDDLWNAAQIQMVEEGKMHGFLRMYWAKKILEWTPTAATALQTGLYLNDRFALDGNDPNGFVGVGWSVMGVHDMGWKERPVFGKIRFMNYAGCKRKFKVKDFVDLYPQAGINAIAAMKKLGMEIPPVKASKPKAKPKAKAKAKGRGIKRKAL